MDKFEILFPVLLIKKSILLIMNVCKIAGLVPNSVDPDHMLHSEASDMDSHCLLKPVCPNTVDSRCLEFQGTR